MDSPLYNSVTGCIQFILQAQELTAAEVADQPECKDRCVYDRSHLSVNIYIYWSAYLSINQSICLMSIYLYSHPLIYWIVSLYCIYQFFQHIYLFISLRSLHGKSFSSHLPCSWKKEKRNLPVPFASGVYWGGPQGRPCCLGLCGDPLHSTTITATITTALWVIFLRMLYYPLQPLCKLLKV